MAHHKGGREVVYVERGGDASAKWLFWGAVLGAGLALLYAPRTGEETRRVLQRKLWKLRAMTEEKLDDIAQQAGPAGGGAPPPRRLPPPHPASRRREQHPIPGQRVDLRRAARGGAVGA